MEPLPNFSFQFSSSPMGLRFRGEDRGEGRVLIDRVFANLGSIPQQMDQALELVADYMRESFSENFDAGGRPTWAPLSPSYLAYRQAMGLGNTILEITGELREEVAGQGPGHVEEIMQTGNTTTLVLGGSSLKFRTHQLGASGSRGPVFASSAKSLRWFGPGGEAIFADSVGPADFEIPARPMLVVQDEDRDGVTRIIRDFIYERLDA